ncbi:Uncharacterized protein TPAR_08504 [Tolypocladium paradoxum]|uniref:Uncharacterized protein n=1 Tax=Tolypocladium paradoxum TaxID=94208 RepID=A0A2S4KM82_9HYPO|nr:Uncharacterized protein TPAR_08504 [Tolypocladium paradoxum]
MCTYARTVFECKHHLWGRRLKLCTIGEDFRAGELASDCAYRKPHGLHSRRVPRRCDKCRALDGKVVLVRAKLEECQAALRERWPAYGAGGAEGKGQSEGGELEMVDGRGVERLDGDGGGKETKDSKQTQQSARTTLNSPPTGRPRTGHNQGLATIQEK